MRALKFTPSAERSDLSDSAHGIYCHNMTGRLDEEALVAAYRDTLVGVCRPTPEVVDALVDLRSRIRVVRAQAVLLEELDLREHLQADRRDGGASEEWQRHKAAVRRERSARPAYYRRLRRHRRAMVVECHRCGRRTMQHEKVSVAGIGLVEMSSVCASLWARGDRGRHTPRPTHPAQLTLFGGD